MSGKTSDVLVLGGGVIGLACAYFVLKAGRSVTVLEQSTVGSGASHGNCGTITPSHATPLAMPGVMSQALKWMLRGDSPLYIKPRLDFELFGWLLRFARKCNWEDFHRIAAIKAPLLVRSRDLLAAMVRDERLDCEYDHSGTLYVFRDEEAFAHSQWLPQALAKVGIPIEPIGGSHARALEPALNESIIGGYYNVGDARLRPDRLVAELARVVRAKGGEIYESTKVTSIDCAEGKVQAVHAGDAQFRGRDVVMALGSWSPAIARQLDLRLPIQPGKGYSITYDRPALCPRVPLVLKERSVCVTSWPSGYRLGSTMEFSGFDSTLNRLRLDALGRAAAEYLHEPVGPRVQEEWYGWRPMTHDDLPILGRPAGLQNLILATGHGMLGVSLAAATGLLVSELIAGTPLSLDVAPLSPTRF